MSDHAHWRSNGKSWKNAAESVGLDPATVAICGSTGTAARVTGDITCPDCLELRESANDHPDRVAGAARLVSTGAAANIRDALAAIDSGAVSFGDKSEEKGEGAEGDAGTQPASVLGLTPRAGTMLLGALPYMLADKVTGWRSDGARRIKPPPIGAVEKVGESITVGLGALPDDIQALINGPIGGLVVGSLIFMMTLQTVDVERGDAPVRESVPDSDLAMGWIQTLGAVLGADG